MSVSQAMNIFARRDYAGGRQRLDWQRNLTQTKWGIGFWAALSSLCVALYALYAADSAQPVHWDLFFKMLSRGALIGAAFASVGALLGFIFGVPRAPKPSPQQVKQSSTPDTSSLSGRATGVPGNDHQLNTNTNLEEISDWLTKILVGAGLAQLAVLPGHLKQLASYVSDWPSPPFMPPAAVLMIIINFFVLGFMASYLLTRLFLREAFQTAEDMGGYGRAAARVEEDVLDIPAGASKAEIDAKYESYIYWCLYIPPPDGFDRVIRASVEYLQSQGADPSPKILAYQAMAYGQKYSWERERKATKESLDSLRNSALEAAQEALKKEPKVLPLLRTVWDPNDPTKLYGEENDLEVFFNDPGFKQLLSPTKT